jgi:hypothetical protein
LRRNGGGKAVVSGLGEIGVAFFLGLNTKNHVGGPLRLGGSGDDQSEIALEGCNPGLQIRCGVLLEYGRTPIRDSASRLIDCFARRFRSGVGNGKTRFKCAYPNNSFVIQVLEPIFAVDVP